MITALAIGGVADGQMITGDEYAKQARAFGRPAVTTVLGALQDPVINENLYRLVDINLSDGRGKMAIRLWVEHSLKDEEVLPRLAMCYRPIVFAA